MTKKVTIALDAMGGDNAPECVLEGASRALKKVSDVEIAVFGNEALISEKIKSCSYLSKYCRIYHTDGVVLPEEKPSMALKKGANTSMRLAINSVADGKADAIISAGNTGALMAMSKFVLKTLSGIDRPALASVFPSESGLCVVLDIGANVECDSNNLFQFALMGDGYAKAVLGIESPRVGLLNIGSEDVKGNDSVKNAANMLRNCGLPLNFCGFVEGNDITAGTVDVVVTDGFTGNIALKTAEGLAKTINKWLKEAFTASPLASFGYLMVHKGLRSIKDRVNPNHAGGAMLLGLNGIVIKCHGNTDAEGIEKAIINARNIVSYDLNNRIKDEIRISSTAIELSSGVSESLANTGL